MGEYDEKCFSNVLSDGYTICSVLSVRLAVAGNALFHLFVFIWQGLFLYLSSRIQEKNDLPGYEYNKIVWYAIIPVATLFPPLLPLLAIIVGSLYELRKVSGCKSYKDWIKSQIILNSSEVDNEVEQEFKSVEFDRYNPATGLPMIGGVDISGNPNGSSRHN